MTTTTPEDSQPFAKAAEKPAQKPTARNSSTAGPSYKAAPVNPAWAEEVVTSFGITGPLAKDTAAKICATVAEAITRKYSQAKLRKLVRSSVVQALK